MADQMTMDSYNQNEVYGFFLNCVLNSRIDMNVESEGGDDNFLNSYIAGVLTSRINRNVGPIEIYKIQTIVASSKGDREKIVRLQMEGDKGLIFHGVFREDTEEYTSVGIAYSSAASICDKIGDSIGEIFSYLDENLDFCMELLFHVGVNYLNVGRGLTEIDVYRMTMPQSAEESLDAFLDYYSLYQKETDPEKKRRLKFHLEETRRIARELNPNIVFPEVE